MTITKLCKVGASVLLLCASAALAGGANDYGIAKPAKPAASGQRSGGANDYGIAATRSGGPNDYGIA